MTWQATPMSVMCEGGGVYRPRVLRLADQRSNNVTVQSPRDPAREAGSQATLLVAQ